MITTATPILTALSYALNENTADTSAKRVSYFNSAMKKILQMYKWNWSKLSYDLTTTKGVQEYDLTVVPGYSPVNGIYEVYKDNKKIYPVAFEERAYYTQDQRYYITPDNKIGFTKEVGDGDVYKLWYYSQWVDISSASETLPMPLPEDIQPAIVMYIKYLVHEAKRQRYDANNALLNFKQIIDELIPKDYSQKTKDNTKRVKHPFEYSGFRRY